LPPSEEEDELAKIRLRELEVQIAASIKNLGFEVEMDDEGRFSYHKPPPEGGQKQPGQDEQIERDPYAGTNIDASQMGQMMEQQGQPTPQENPPATRNKPSSETGPDKRNTGLPREAGNQNVDTRTERRTR